MASTRAGRWVVASLLLAPIGCAGETPSAGTRKAKTSVEAGPAKASPARSPGEGCASIPRAARSPSVNSGAPLDPRRGDRELARGIALTEKGDQHGAGEAFGNAIAADPEIGLAYVLKAETHLFTDNDHAKMLPLLVRALELLPANPRAHLRYAELLAESGQTEQAESHFRCAIELKPDLVEARRWLVQRRLTEGNLGEAEREVKLALADAPDDVQARVLFGAVLEAENRPLDAAKELSAAAELAGRSAALYRRAGTLYEAAGDRLAAKKARAVADHIDPPKKERSLRTLPKRKAKTGRR